MGFNRDYLKQTMEASQALPGRTYNRSVFFFHEPSQFENGSYRMRFTAHDEKNPNGSVLQSLQTIQKVQGEKEGLTKVLAAESYELEEGQEAPSQILSDILKFFYQHPEKKKNSSKAFQEAIEELQPRRTTRFVVLLYADRVEKGRSKKTNEPYYGLRPLGETVDNPDPLLVVLNIDFQGFLESVDALLEKYPFMAERNKQGVWINFTKNGNKYSLNVIEKPSALTEREKEILEKNYPNIKKFNDKYHKGEEEIMGALEEAWWFKFLPKMGLNIVADEDDDSPADQPLVAASVKQPWEA